MSRSRSMNRDYASAKDRAVKHGSGFEAPYLKIPKGMAQFRPKEGIYLLDILAYRAGAGNPFAKEGRLFYERTFFTHRAIGPNNDSHLCLAKTFDQPCPVCEHRFQLRKKSDEDLDDLIKSLVPKERQLFNVINLKEPDKGVQLMDLSYHAFGKRLDKELNDADEDDEWDLFFLYDEHGRTLKVGFDEESFGSGKFISASSLHFKPRKSEYDKEEMLEKVACLDDILVPLEYDELKELFLQTVDEDEEGKGAKRKSKDRDDDDDDDDDDGKARKRSKDDDDDDDDDAPKGRRSKEKDDDEDDDDGKPSKKKSKDDDDDDDDDDAPPKKKEKSKASKDDDDDDWDDFDKDDKKSKASKDDDDDDDDDGKASKKKKNRFEDDDDDDEKPRVKAGKEDDDDDDDDEPPKKRKKVKAGADDDDDDDDDGDDD